MTSDPPLESQPRRHTVAAGCAALSSLLALAHSLSRPSQVLSTAGDTHLGGEDLDNRLVEHLLTLFQKKNPAAQLRSNPSAMHKLRREAERAKRLLSSQMTAHVEVESILPGKDLYATRPAPVLRSSQATAAVSLTYCVPHWTIPTRSSTASVDWGAGGSVPPGCEPPFRSSTSNLRRQPPEPVPPPRYRE